jgi:hypothetical protein
MVTQNISTLVVVIHANNAEFSKRDSKVFTIHRDSDTVLEGGVEMILSGKNLTEINLTVKSKNHLLDLYGADFEFRVKREQNLGKFLRDPSIRVVKATPASRTSKYIVTNLNIGECIRISAKTRVKNASASRNNFVWSGWMGESEFCAKPKPLPLNEQVTDFSCDQEPERYQFLLNWKVSPTFSISLLK